MNLAEDYQGSHPNTTHVLKFLDPNPNLTGHQAGIATIVQNFAASILDEIDESPELTVGLRKLLEAKDCFIRASLNLNG